MSCERCSRAHQIDAMLEHPPRGHHLNTREPSRELSGGQWQRITAARGFFRDAELLIMDEPSSALDPRAEAALFQTIRNRQETKTTILITHRLANVRHADRIFVLHHGRLLEAGTHDELVAAGGHYADLFALQASGYHAELEHDEAAAAVPSPTASQRPIPAQAQPS